MTKEQTKYDLKSRYYDETKMESTETQVEIAAECDAIKKMLLEKNKKYGDSAIYPKRIFSKVDPVEQINIRIDDKISRIMSNQDGDTEDPIFDLIGYLILRRIAQKIHSMGK